MKNQAMATELEKRTGIEEILKPEKQDMDMYVGGINEIVATQKRVAESYFLDGSVEAACPPLCEVPRFENRG